MLQRAASNAYSWWWATHIRAKQSKWLEQNLHDMEEKVNDMMKIIDDDGDSFAKRAEMYYRKRPELIEHVQESLRAYRALAERYNHLSKELQSANRTIASIFPERVQYSIDDDDLEECFTQASNSANNPDQSTTGMGGTQKLRIPKVPKFPEKSFRSPSMIRKSQQLNISSSTGKAAATPKSGLSKTEALEEIDKLQKEILAQQTEMEFVKSLYERECEKYWMIENNITLMQKRVSSLQDEFDIRTVIEDNEARTLMAVTALKSCEETLSKLQEDQAQTAEEARQENSRIKEVNMKFETLKRKFLQEQTDHHESTNAPKLTRTRHLQISDQQCASMGEERQNMELLSKKVREQLEVNSNSPLTVPELAEKIDELVNKVVTLETAVSSQTYLVKRLKSDTGVLQENVQRLENDNEFLMEGSEHMRKRLNELEEELTRVRTLNQYIEIQNDNLQTQFTEASCNVDHLSSKLQTVKLDEEAENTEVLQNLIAVPEAKTSEEQTNEEAPDAEADVKLERRTDVSLKLSNFHIDEEQEQFNPSNKLGPVSEKPTEPKQDEKYERPEHETGNIPIDSEANEFRLEEKRKPTLRQLFLKGLEERERLLLEEYTSVLRDYKDVRNKLSEVEQKNRDSIFELAMQVKELKDVISSKDAVIKSLVSETDLETNATDVDQELASESNNEAASPLDSGISPNLDQVSISDTFGEHSLESTERSYKSSRNTEISPRKEVENRKLNGVDKTNTISIIEERLRSDIDELLEVNLEFWLRFSTSVHQIQKFHTSIQDLQVELLRLKENNKQEGSTKQQSMQSNVRPIYRHLREIQTELSLWLEHNAVLKDELRSRYSSLCNIQNEISRVMDACPAGEKKGLGEYKAAKFQGEVLNMKQENRKIADELQIGHSRVRGLQVQVEKTLEKLGQELSIQSQVKQSISRTRIPLRSFLFGVKLRRQKPSIFSCANPALQKQYSDLAMEHPPE